MKAYSVTKEYLVTNFKPCEGGFVFEKENSKELYNKIKYAFANELKKPTKDELREDIRKAFGDFFIDCAKAVILFKDETITVKLLYYKTIKHEEGLVDKIVAYVKSIEEKLDNNKNNQVTANTIIIPSEEVKKINDLFKNINSPINYREIIRKALIDAYKLRTKDLILFLNEKIVIKLFCEKDEKECERRFEGLPPEDIESLALKIFPDEEKLIEEIENIVNKLLETELNFSKINHTMFETMHIKLLQNEIKKLLKRKTIQLEVVIEALANYVLREYFFYIHELMAEKLLELIEKKDQGATSFLETYKGNMVVIDGQKYIYPEILDSSNQRWSVFAITNFVLQYSRDKQNVEKKHAELMSMTNEQQQIQDKLKLLRTEQIELEKEIAKATDKMQNLTKKLEQTRINLKEKRNKALKSGSTDDKLLEFENHAKEIAASNRNFFEYMQNLDIKYKNVKKDITDAIKKTKFLDLKITSSSQGYKYMKNIFEKTEEKYDDLIIAISRALVQKRKKVK